jgi:hypothetical protein
LKREREKLKVIEVSAYKTEVEVDKLLNKTKIVSRHRHIESQLNAKKGMMEEY